MRIAITNAVISNAGDAAILAGIVASLKAEGLCTDREVVVFDSNAETTSVLYPQWQVRQQLTVPVARSHSFPSRAYRWARRRLLRRAPAHPRIAAALARLWPLRNSAAARAYRTLSGADLVISTGGTYLVDHYDFDDKVVELEIAQSLGKPVYLWTQSMGPFSSDRARASVSRLAKVVDGAFFRDRKSFDHWRSVNPLPALASVVPDVAFALVAPEKSAATESSLRALLSVRDWKHRGAGGGEYASSSYERAMRALAARLLEQGYAVTAVSTCQGLASYPIDDSLLAQRIFADLPVAVDTEHHTPGDLQRLIAESDLVVTTRMHLGILALLGGAPTLAVAYEFKTMELFQGLGRGDQAVAIEALDDDWVDAVTTRLQEERESLRLSPAAIDEVRQGAHAPARALATGLFARHP